MVEPTRRGGAAGAIVVALAVASIIFRDLLIGVALLLVLVVILAEVIWVTVATRNPGTKFIVEREGAIPGTGRVILHPGQESLSHARLTKRIGGAVHLGSRIPFLDIAPAKLQGTGNFPIDLRFVTQYSGEYTGSGLDLRVTGPVGLFSSTASTPFSLKYVVYPRLLWVAAAAVRLLALAEVGETPIDLPGVGSEYYEMRNYLPGDDVRSVNWKASAREGELIVVEHMREVGSHILLVMDARARGFDEADRLASTFLSVANSLWAAGLDFGVLVHDGAKVTEFSTEEDQRRSLRSALRAAVTFTKLDSYPEFLELVPMRASKESRLGLSASGLLSEFGEVQNLESGLKLGAGDPWIAVADYVRASQTGSVVYVSALTGNIQHLVELAWESRHFRDVEFFVANPCDIDSNHSQYLRPAKALNAVGASYFRGEPADVVRRVLAA